MISFRTPLLLALPILVAACASGGQQLGSRQTVGGLGGAALGGFLGSQIGSGTGQLAATAGGALLGGLIGADIGRQLDDVDRLRMNQTANQALAFNAAGVSSTWNNPTTGNAGVFTPQQTFSTQSGRTCRTFTQSIFIDGREEIAQGTACQRPDGVWEVVS